MKVKGQDLASFFFRVLPPTAGGMLGAIIFLLAFSALQDLAIANATNQTFVNFAVAAMSFCGVVFANFFAAFFLQLASESSANRGKILLNVLIANVLLFALALPFLLFGESLLLPVVVFFVFAIFATQLCCEIFAGGFSVATLHFLLLATCLQVLAFLKIFPQGGQELTFVLVFVLPLSHFVCSVFAGIAVIVERFLGSGLNHPGGK